MHKREAIRDQIIANIINGVLIVGSNVFKGRVYPMDDAALPGACVYVGGETSTLGTTMGYPRTSERVLEININVYVKGEPDITASLNNIAAEIETEVGKDLTVSGLALDLYFSAWSESLNGDQTDRAQGEKTGVGQMTLQVLYDCPENNPSFT